MKISAKDIKLSAARSVSGLRSKALPAGSDTNRLALDVRNQLSAQCLASDQINEAPKKDFEIELDAEVALRG